MVKSTWKRQNFRIMKIFVNQYKKILIFISLCFSFGSYDISARTIHVETILRKKHKISTSSKKLKTLKRNRYKSRNHLERSGKIQIYKLSSMQINQLIKDAKSYLGTPYRYGGHSKTGIDCSAFIINVFEPWNISLPRVSSKQALEGIPISRSQMQKGDLLFFATKRSRERVSHVGLVLDREGDDVSFIHASLSNGVTISHLKEPYWKKRFIAVRRILIEEPVELMPLVESSQEYGFSSREDAMFDR